MSPVLISAHRGGFEGDTRVENTPEAIAKSIGLGVDYVEIDVQRTSDGVFVIAHDDYFPNNPRMLISSNSFTTLLNENPMLLTLTQALSMMKGKVGAHIDLKFSSVSAADDWEESLVRLVLDILGDSDFILTSLEDSSILRMRNFLDSLGCSQILVGLSLGRDIAHMNLMRRLKIRTSELLPGRRLRKSRANLVVVNYKLAKISVLSWAKRAELPVLIWTVDESQDIDYFLAESQVWMITTNFPRLALERRNLRSRG